MTAPETERPRLTSARRTVGPVADARPPCRADHPSEGVCGCEACSADDFNDARRCGDL